MGFFGFESEEEKQAKKKLADEKIKMETAINSLPIYFTSAVDFNYKIIRGDIYFWCTGENDFEEKYNSALRSLRETGYECGADCLIDVKFNISTGVYGKAFYVIHATGIAVKRIDNK